MIYFYYGTNSNKARARAKAVLGVMKKKRPEAEFFRITTDSWSEAEFEGLIAGQGLFDQKFIVYVDGVFDNITAKEWIISRIKELGDSENAFVFFETKIDAVSLKKIKSAAKEAEEFDVPAGKTVSSLPATFTGGDFKVFALSDALGRRDRKELWALYAEALLRGISAEEVNGMLFWQIKSMILARESMGAKEAGLNPYVFTKSKRYAANFKEGELVVASQDLVRLYHDSRRGKFDLSSGLERFVLKI